MKQLLLADNAGMTDRELRDWIISNFEISESLLDKYEILIAEHNTGDYEGDAYLLLKHRDARQPLFLLWDSRDNSNLSS